MQNPQSPAINGVESSFLFLRCQTQDITVQYIKNRMVVYLNDFISDFIL